MIVPALARRCWHTIASCVLCACAADGADGVDRATPRVVLGTGEAEFEPMDGEPHLPLVAGVQGGFHAWASFLAYDFSAPRVDMLLETRVEDDPASSLVMRARLSLRETLDADGARAQSFAGFPAQVAGARCADAKRVSVHVTLSDAAGDSAEDTRYYVAELPAAQRSDSCP